MEVPTFGNQSKLPKLPLPELRSTCERYLSVLKPLLGTQEYEKTESIVKDFLENEGPEMHANLIEYREKVDNYVEEFWDDSYLNTRDPLVLNVNPVFVLEDDPTPSRNSQIARASSLVLSSIKFIRALRSQTLTPDLIKRTPLCMSQFSNVIGSARVPVFSNEDGSGDYVKDKIVTFEHSQHILVLSMGQFYYFDVIWPDGTPAVTQREITRNLEKILADSRRKGVAQVAAEAVGTLTSEERGQWANLRRRLMNLSDNNRGILKVVDSALFVLCLDDVPTSNPDEITANMLHGTYEVEGQTGIQRGSCLNRWYDKLQIIVTASGNAGVNFEHSAVDGHTVLRFASDVFTDTIIRFAQTISGPRVRSFIGESSIRDLSKNQANGSEINHNSVVKQVAATRKPDTRPRKLEFDLEENTKNSIHFAERRLSDMILQNETCSIEFTGYGKTYIVQNSMSPDAFVQIAILAAYYHLYGCMVNTYESVQTKAFLHGRTEAARSATEEASKFLKIWNKKGIDGVRKVEALRNALRAHSSMTQEAAKGMGVDRHLFALKCLFQKQFPEKPLPGIFLDKGYSVLSTSIISTSNCGNPSLRFFGFGPVTPQGFGIGYIIKDEAIHFCITSKHRQTRRFATALQNYLGAVQDLLLELEPEGGTPREASQSFSRNGQQEGLEGYGFFGEFENPLLSNEPPVGRALSDIPLSSSMRE